MHEIPGGRTTECRNTVVVGVQHSSRSVEENYKDVTSRIAFSPGDLSKHSVLRELKRSQ